MKKLQITFLCLLLSTLSIAQLDNEPFYDQDSLVGSKNDLFVGIKSFAFNKNDEYYTRFANGQTFFGYNISPELQYYVADNIRVDVGLMTWKDFGNADYTAIYPTYSLIVDREKSRFVFGNIKANLNHRYIEPLFDFNRLIYQPVENRIQYLYNDDKIRLDAWVDWQRMIYEGSPFQELIYAGATIDYNLVDNEKHRLDIPLQYIVSHTGGQIDTITGQLGLAGNGALGVDYSCKPEGWLDKIKFQGYFCFWEDYFNNYGQLAKNGNGIYMNLSFEKKQHQLMFSYWNGNRYQSVAGGPIFMSESIAVKNTGEFQSTRQLLFIRFISNYKLAEGLDLSLRFEPYYDFALTPKQTFTNRIFGFTNGLYFKLEKNFFVTSLKEKRKAE